MSKKILASIALISSLSLVACSPAGSELTAEPYGGQCQTIGPNVFSSYQAIRVTGAAYFSILEDKLLDQVWDAGYKNLDEWMKDTESVYTVLSSVDTSSMTAEEIERIEYLMQALFPGTMFEALRVSDTDWFKKTYSELGAVAAYCDGYWE